MAHEKTYRSSLTDMTAAELSAYYAEMRKRLNERYVPEPEDPNAPKCICSTYFPSGMLQSYTYNPACPRCPKRSV